MVPVALPAWLSVGRGILFARLGRMGVVSAIALALGVTLAPPAAAQDATPTVSPSAPPPTAPPPTPPPPTPPPPTPPAASTTLAPTPNLPSDLGRIPAYVVGGLAVVTLGVGAVFGGLSVSEHRQFVEHPTGAAANTGDSHELTADMCFGGAATLAVAAVVMFLTHEPPAPEPAPAALHVGWSPVVGPHSAGAGASISF